MPASGVRMVQYEGVMGQDDFEGSRILEQLAARGLVDDFLEAIDSDDVEGIISLLRDAEVDDESIQVVLKKLLSSDGKH